jgi:hypothetical protein
MTSDDFETRLQRQSPRQVPVAWREEILRTAQAAVAAPAALPSSILNHLSAILWPHPKAWAGLAAAWVVIGLLQFAARDHSQVTTARAPATPSRETILARREQQQLWAELAGTSLTAVADRPRNSAPRPRSELREESQTV